MRTIAVLLRLLNASFTCRPEVLQIIGIGSKNRDLMALASQALRDLDKVAGSTAGNRLVELDNMEDVHMVDLALALSCGCKRRMQHIKIERLRNNKIHTARPCVGLIDLRSPAGNKDDHNLRVKLADVTNQIPAIHIRHPEIGADNIKGTGAKGKQRAITIPCAADSMIVHLKQPGQHITHGKII